jgi:16S rRNA (guanine966-N2)-methyltransferase
VRVIAGSAGGRPLQAPPGRDVRPTSDRVREAMFSSLAEHVAGARVLDLFAGSGALGVEALSRGAAHAVFVERDRRAVAVIRRNLAALGLQDRATVRPEDAGRFCRTGRGGPYDLVFADPPYAEPTAAIHALLVQLAAAGAVREDAVVVIERDRRDPDLGLDPPAFLASERMRSYGDTVLVYLRVCAPPTESRP